MNPILEWGIPVIQWMQSLGTWLEPVMQFFTFLGTENFYLLILPIFIWWIDIGLGIRIGLALLLSAMINTILKIIFGMPRPYWVSDHVRVYSSESSFGLPSGHAQNAAVLWGLIAARSKQMWIRVLMIVLIVMITISRNYLGVHFPSDSLAGLLVGSLILLIFIRLEKPFIERFGSLKLAQQTMIVAFATVILLGIGLGSLYFTRMRLIPDEWVIRAAAAVPGSEAIDPTSAEPLISNAATFFGLSYGAVLLLKWGKFNPEGSWGQRMGRYLLGLVGLILLFFGLRFLFPTGPHLLSAIFRFVRYALVGLWVAYLAPRLFVAVRLA